MLVELLDSEPDWSGFLTAHSQAVARIPRLRERVIEPSLPVTAPRWSPDVTFDLGHHVRKVDLGGSATRTDLLAYCEKEWEQALDRQRPPWVATLVLGLADGKAAYLFKCHHSLTDGMGLVQLMDLLHDGRQDDDLGPNLPVRTRRILTPRVLMVQGLTDVVKDVPNTLGVAATSIRAALSDPLREARRKVVYGRSLSRLLGSMPPRSPLLRGAGGKNRLLMLDVELDALRRAGRTVNGSVNDAYVAAILGGLRRYHETFGADVERIPIAMPISLRSSDDPGGGNRFAGVRFAAPLAEPDPAARMRLIGAFVRTVRAEPAITYLDGVSAALSRLPRPALIEVTARATAVADMQISNIPGLRRPAYLAGARAIGMFPFGPRPGVPAMVTMMTLEGRGCIGLNLDANVFRDMELLRDCLNAGIDEVLNLAPENEDERA